MVVENLHIAFDIEMDKTMDYEYPYISPEQKDYWLCKAQDRLVKHRAFGNNLFKSTFEETQKRIDDLRTIVKKESIVPVNTSLLAVTQLPSDYQYLFRHQCTTSSTLGGNTIVAGLQVKNDKIGTIKKNPFEKPVQSEPIYYLEGNTIVYELVDSSFTIINTTITYIKKYRPIRYGVAYTSPLTNSECELPEHTHSEIVDIAVSMVLENIESPRYQSNNNELTKTE